jgi:carbon-monoxide dehydrogenase large subunit
MIPSHHDNVFAATRPTKWQSPIFMKRINTFIGSPVERVEDLRYLRGRGQYVDDLVRPGQWHATIVRSPVAHGRLRTIDTAAALTMPGVHAVVTAQDLNRPIPKIAFRRPSAAIVPYAQPVLANDVLRYVGEPVAMVLADSVELAEDAAQSVALDIQPLPVVADRHASMRNDVRLIDGTETNCATIYVANAGDVETTFRNAAYTRREQFRVQRMTAMTMETRGLLAEWDATAGRLVISGAAKLPFFNRRAMAKMMGLSEQAVDYIEYDVGGGFGARGEFYPEDFLVAFAARKFGRPVKWIEDRREHFMAIGHSRETECDLEIAFDSDGTILGLRGDIWVDIGAYVRPNGMTPVRNVTQFTTGPYRVPHQHVKTHAMITNKTPSGTYRGPGRYEGCFFMERLIDLAAKDLRLDRLEIRRRNLIGLSEMPYAMALVRPNDGFNDTACDSGDYAMTFDRCVTEAGWGDKIKLNGKLIDGRYHGLGIACFIEGGGSGPSESARISIEQDGSLAVYVGSSSVGQGVETIMAQIAADALEVPFEQVRLYHGSTTYLPDGYGSYGSRATVMGGNAIVRTAQALLDKIRVAAGERFGVAAETIEVTEGVIHAPNRRRATLAEFSGLCVDGRFDNSKNTYTYGTAIAHVSVDPRTGGVEVLDYLVVDDVGRIINPETLHGQVIGAAVQGLGSTFTEEIIYDQDGQLLVASLADYLVPVATDYPVVRAISLEAHPSPNNPLGAKGAGEGGIIPVGAALANAVAAALSSLGVEPRELPLTPPRLWQLIEGADKS